ncbi:hypothetical protein PIROE2DRAFT_3431 [Piromyces sp. E2]|nr:hypothetical protein PIROE2DRAFT_3431 [Piromyces sp. E2]|eukprot:OUM68746.1 hypothetical protein PIROE2DRAFT_3431 [Piromyces sp. E2]
MKHFILFHFFGLVLVYTIFANIIPDFNNEFNIVVEKREESSEECKYINNLFKNEKSLNCCDYFGIICENGHITKISSDLQSLENLKELTHL